MRSCPFEEATFLRFFQTLDEHQARLCAAERALALGLGGITRLSRVTGLSAPTIRKGIRELQGLEPPPGPGRVRRPGGGRKRVEVRDPDLVAGLQEVVEASTAGSPMDVLRWTSKSKAKLASALAARGHAVSPNTVGRLLREQGYSLQANRKDKEGHSPPEREAQIAYLNEQARRSLARGQPVISVDTKKKELIGEFTNGGRTWRPKGQPVRVQVHDFPSSAIGKAIPYGVYDLGRNTGWVSVGTDHDTAAFAVATLRRWWEQVGHRAYPAAERLLACADAGGSNGYRVRAWKTELARLAAETGLQVTVCHLPPGTSKWNRIEHRLFSAISMNWRGRPLVSHEAIVELIAATTTHTGLRVQAELDRGRYPLGVKVRDQELAAVPLTRHEFHGEWNYTIQPAA